MAQPDRADTPIAVEEAVGRREVLEDEIAVVAALLLQYGMDAAKARISEGQFAGGVTADAIAAILELELLLALVTEPELQLRLVGSEGAPGLPAGGRALADWTAQDRCGEGPPTAANGGGSDAVEQGLPPTGLRH